MESNRHPDKVGIYIHIPFCEKKCFYCDFYSISRTGNGGMAIVGGGGDGSAENRSRQDEFVRSLVKEIELFSKTYPDKLFADTIFFGGGTPSLLSPRELEFILNALHKCFNILTGAEFSVECNPGTVNRHSLSDYRQLGANRLSFGVQSFFNDELTFLSRIHNSQQAIVAFESARSAGYDNVNIDLMYGLPEQTDRRLLSNLEHAVALKPEHISAYNLIVERGTPLFTAVASGEIKPLDNSAEAGMYELAMSFLKENGYEHYEISNYTRDGFECKHNLKYWNGEEYIGFGPSAHSYLGNSRWWNISNLSGYISDLSDDRLPISAREELTEAQRVDEFVMLQLRQGKLELKTLHKKFGIDLDSAFISDLKKTGYADAFEDRILLTDSGFVVCDEIAEKVLASNLIKV
ncbi:MAG: radical SAM family heme chaperone HemW [Candidatus Kryptoniota bacterium]